MNYELHFHPLALKEWKKLSNETKIQFKKILSRRIENPHIISAKLSGDLQNCYKIKLHKLGFRLVYQVKENYIVVLSVGKRNKSIVYKTAGLRIH